jgi:hypothetical protein
MGLIITPQAKIEEYFQSDALSQSSLKGLLGDIDSFLSNQQNEDELFYKEKGNLIIGSAVDTILTGEEGQFDEEYYVSQIENKPSEIEMSIIQMVFADVVDSYTDKQIEEEGFEALSQYPGSIQAAVEEHGWQSRWKMETRVNKIIEVGSEYFDDLKRAYGKQIISEQDRLLIQDIVESLRTNPRTKDYFDRGRFMRTTEVDVYYQLPIYFKYKGIDCKALLDMVIVFKNPDTKAIEAIQPIDLKTMYGSTFTFINSLKRFRYDIQAAWYSLALDIYFGISEKNITLKPFMFIVESTTETGKPLIYKLSEELMRIGRYGREELKSTDLSWSASVDIIISREIKGFEQLVDDYLYYSETEWKEEKVVTENDGVLELNWDGIK